MSDPRLQTLLDLIDQAYDRKAWHGTNLKGSIRGLAPKLACWRPGQSRRSIAEIVVHCAYWKYAARRRITGEKRGSFVLKGSNWFPIEAALEESEWRCYTRLLETEHRLLVEALSTITLARLSETPIGGKFTVQNLVLGVASHDLYHAGQIQLIKKLAGSMQRG